MEQNNDWIGVDLDGTLAQYDLWNGPTHIGPPIPAMVLRVKTWLADNKKVKIFTARVCDEQTSEDLSLALEAIYDWCVKHIGKPLPVTCKKDWHMIELWDDRCVKVEKNTGRILSQQ